MPKNQRHMIPAQTMQSRSLMLHPCRVLLALLFATVLAGCGNSPNPQAASKGGGKKGFQRGSMTVSVAVAKAELRDVPVYLQGLGSVEAFNTVVVKSRLDGQLVEIHFKEGQEV